METVAPRLGGTPDTTPLYVILHRRCSKKRILYLCRCIGQGNSSHSLHQGDKPPRTDWDRLCLREGEVAASAWSNYPKTWAFTHVTRDVIHPQRFDRFSKFSTLLTAIAHLIHVARSFAHSTQDECQGWHVCRPAEEELLKAKVCIVKSVQNECYSEELKCINSGSNIPPSSSLWKLHPILDQNQLLRVGGWIE